MKCSTRNFMADLALGLFIGAVLIGMLWFGSGGGC